MSRSVTVTTVVIILFLPLLTSNGLGAQNQSESSNIANVTGPHPGRKDNLSIKKCYRTCWPTYNQCNFFRYCHNELYGICRLE